MSRDRKRPTNKGSNLLQEDENECLYSLLGNNNYTISSGVVQLLMAEPAMRSQWSKKLVGTVCFVKDYGLKSYFIRIYDIEARKLLWEQRLYEDFATNRPHTNLVTFEGEECRIGLNFSDSGEAGNFKQALDRKRDQDEKTKRRAAVNGAPQGEFQNNQSSQLGIVAPSRPVPQQNETNFFGGKKKSKNNKKTKYRKEDISQPTNFVHKVHVGWDPNEGFKQKTSGSDNMLDPDIQDLLDSLFGKKNYKRDKKFIYDFLENYGGVDALKEEIKNNPPPARPSAAPSSSASRRAPSRPVPEKTGPPPPPPPRDQQFGGRSGNGAQQFGMPNPPQRPLPPPPPPMQNIVSPGRPSAGPPPPPPSGVGGGYSSRSHAPQPPAAVGAPVPPPPPPPMMTGGGAPPPPPPGPPPPSGLPNGGGSDRSNLMEQIRQGTGLRPVDSSGSGDAAKGAPVEGRDALMEGIRGGIQLKKVDQSEIDENRNSNLESMGGIAGALARALAERRVDIASDSSDEDDDEEEDDDDWD